MEIRKDGAVSALLAPIPLPKMFRAKQTFPRESISPDRIPEVVEARIAQPLFAQKIQPGMSIAITVGSRGIANVITKRFFDKIDLEMMYPNSQHIGNIMLSQAYYADVLAGKYPGLEALSQPEYMEFDEEGALLTPITEG